MEEEKTEQIFMVWVNKEDRVVIFRELGGFEKITFRSQQEKMSYVYHLCETGYRAL